MGVEAKSVRGHKASLKRRWQVAAGVSLLLLLVDLGRPPSSQVSTAVLLLGIDAYQATLSRALKRSGAQCRFTPSCSHYGEAVIRKHGALKGSGLAAWRILRCGPWTPQGAADPP